MPSKYREAMAKLAQQSRVAKGTLEELKAAGQDTWETLVGEMDKLGDAFKHAFNHFKSQV